MIKNGLIVGFINLGLGFAFNFVIEKLIPSLAKDYQNIALFRPWNDPLMMIYFFYPFIAGFVLFYLWGLIKNQLLGSDLKKAFRFASIYFLIATIPGMFISYTTFQVSLLMILSWTLSGFIQVFIAGFIFTKLNKTS